MSLESTDNLIIQRGDSLYKVNKDNLMDKLQDDDLLIVGRGSNCYKISGLQFKEEVGGGGGGVVDPGLVSGGTLYQIRDANQPPFDVRVFDTDGDLVVSGSNDVLMSIYVIAGGAGGGFTGGGGGAGGVVELYLSVPPGTHSMTIGAAGRGGGNYGSPTQYEGENGGNTVLTIGSTTYTAIGGGGGANANVGHAGGSGGGGYGGAQGGSGVDGQGYKGGKAAAAGTGPSGGGGGYAVQGDDNSKSGTLYGSGTGGGGGAIKWGLPDSVVGTENGLTRFAAGGGGQGPSSIYYPHGGVPYSFGAGGNAGPSYSGGYSGGPGAVLVRYFISE